MEKKISVLMIEDSIEDVKFATHQLKQSFGDQHVLQTTDYFSKAEKIIEENEFDIIILDLSLPDSNGMLTFRKLIDSTKIPIIVYTGLSNEQVKASAMKSGAHDYLIKGETTIEILKRSILRALSAES